jgi:hypothetical protein
MPVVGFRWRSWNSPPISMAAALLRSGLPLASDVQARAPCWGVTHGDHDTTEAGDHSHVNDLARGYAGASACKITSPRPLSMYNMER